MSTIKWVGFRLLVNLFFSLFGRKSRQVKFEVEWKALPYDWDVDYFTEGDRKIARGTGTCPKARSFK